MTNTKIYYNFIVLDIKILLVNDEGTNKERKKRLKN